MVYSGFRFNLLPIEIIYTKIRVIRKVVTLYMYVNVMYTIYYGV